MIPGPDARKKKSDRRHGEHGRWEEGRSMATLYGLVSMA